MEHASDMTRILLVDDDEDFLFQHRIQLESAGFEVVTAESRREAEDAVASFTPDVAIVDLVMEERDGGFILARHLKQAFPGLPVILATSALGKDGLVLDPASSPEHASEQVDVVMGKPIRFEQLRREIGRLLAGRSH